MRNTRQLDAFQELVLQMFCMQNSRDTLNVQSAERVFVRLTGKSAPTCGAFFPRHQRNGAFCTGRRYDVIPEGIRGVYSLLQLFCRD